jgi:hypothetical protein
MNHYVQLNVEDSNFVDSNNTKRLIHYYILKWHMVKMSDVDKKSCQVVGRGTTEAQKMRCYLFAQE